jgi:NADH dehydrogenase
MMGTPNKTDEILVVGGGFAGFWAALAAKRVVGERSGVAMISREPVLQMRPRLYQARPETLGVDLLPLLRDAGVRFIKGEAVGLDAAAHTVELADAARVKYARLVVATGSAMRRPPVPGAENAYSIDTQDEAVVFDRRLAQIAGRVSRPVIAIVGAGFSGIELATELRDRLAAHSDGNSTEQARIMLLDRADVVGPELGLGPRRVIEEALVRAGVELRLGANIISLALDRVTLADGTILAADAVVLTTGLAAASFAGHVPGERDALGRVVVDRSLRAPGARDVFVAGDAAAADTGDGHRALQSCQHALQLGRFAGENAARDLLGMPTLSYTQPRYVTCLDLGRSGAVMTEGWDRIVVHAGAEAKAIKQRINTKAIYPPADVKAETLLSLSSTVPAEQSLN